MEYDEQKFKEDIEKAKALSLETMALDQYRRKKLQYASVNDVTDGSQSQLKLSTSQSNLDRLASFTDQATTRNIWIDLPSSPPLMSNRSTTRPRPGSLGNASSTTSYGFGSSFPTSSSGGSLAPPPQAIQRNISSRNTTANTSNTSKTTNETNLMSFNDDSSLLVSDSVLLTSPINDPHTEFMQKIDKMHRQHAQFSEAVVPVMPTPVFQHPATILTTANGAPSMALMPYNGLNSYQTTKKPLTPDELSKLYNMGPFGQPLNQSPQYLPGGTINTQSQYIQQKAQQTIMYSYPYAQTIERPINKPIPYTLEQQSPNSAGMVNMLTMQQHTKTANFSNSNSSTNIENSLALLPPNQITNSIDSKTIPFITEPHHQSRKSMINHCDNAQCGNSNNGGSSSIAIPRRTSNATPQNGDLIDLNQRIEDTSRVSVLEAFDPLLLNDSSDTSDQGDSASECGTSYYSEYDPFDYLYSCGTQYSDPVYEAAHKFDRTPMSPANNENYASNQEHFSKLSEWGDTNEWGDYDDGFVKIDDMTAPPPIPPRNSAQQINNVGTVLPPIDRGNKIDRFKVATKLDENIIVNRTYDADLVAFYNMVKNVRSKFKFNDEISNVGHIVAAEYDNHYPEGTEIKLLVHPYLNLTNKNLINRNSASDSGIESSMSDLAIESNGLNSQKGLIEGYGPPVAFTCDICTTVEHVIMHVFCELEGQLCSGSVEDYILKPIAVNEWLRPTSKLSQLDCVHQSLKLEQDVQFGLWPKSQADLKCLARTQQDDARDADIRLEDILTHEPVETIKYGDLKILLQTLESEIAKIELAAADSRPHAIVSYSGVVQAVKMICILLGSIDTLNITSAIGELNRVAASGQSSYSYLDRGGVLEVDSEIGDYAKVKLRPKTFQEQIKYCCNRIREAVRSLLDIFSHAFRVDFCVEMAIYRTNPIPLTNIKDEVMVQIMCLHRVPPHWKHDYYILVAQLSHGTCYISDPIVTQCSNEKSGLFAQNLKFDTCLKFDRIPISTLPRESRLTFVLYGCTTEPAEGSNNANTNNDTGDNPQSKVAKIELGWSSIQFFDFERQMIEGSYLLPQWPPTADRFLGPAPAKGTHPRGGQCPTLSINVPSHGGRIVFPEIPQNSSADRLDLNSLDKNLQQELIDMAEQGYPMALAKREVFWEKRFYLHKLPHALPKILHAAHSWDFDSVRDLHALVQLWKPLSPLQAFELLLPRYPDMVVRAQAVKWISAMSNDQLADYLPQLVQALKHDTYEASELAEFLLTRSLESPRIAHHLYWLFVHSLPGDSPQNTIDQTQIDFDESILTMTRYDRRNLMMLRSLLATCGKNLSDRFLGQNMMCSTLARIASNVKQAKESVRQKVLVHGMEEVHQNLLGQPTALPLSPSFEVTAVNSRSCGYFNSNTLPLKVSFVGPDRKILPAIFKAGDDLQQDMLTIQLVRVMDRLWLQEGLDLKMVTFNCIPTGHKRGMIEMVTDAETLRKIQVEWGLTGSFKDKPIAEWLERQNPSQLEYQRAVDNFTVSCAGYSVVTYILGICDRHNDNIMLKTSGHLFHIDFGKFLGDAQMFGNFKRDRTPFVLTSDMAYVINMGDRPSIKFQHFVDLCCKAFNIVRKHGDLLLHMLALMATSGIPGVTADAVNYVRTALLPGQSNPEAAASFAKLIHISLKSWFTQFNFFLHNLAQMRFAADDCNGELLTFVPRTYTMAQDGRLESVTVYGYQKRYDLEKYYTYILKVTRQNQPDPAYLFRSYKEFSELHQKLCIHFPLSKLHSLPSGIHVGRSNIKTVAERRLPEIRLFLISLFNSADEIAHSDLVYTFFHPLLRDQQEQDIHVAKVKDTRPIANARDNVRGEIKLSAQYHRGALTVMIYHARSLPTSTGGQEPNTYVKTYLIPDSTKSTKRKTKVVRKNCFPTFMETLEYRMPLESIQNRVLQVTVWSHDSLQENEFLGGVEIHLGDLDLREEFSKWFPLGYVTRT